MPGFRLTPTAPAPTVPVIELDYGQSKTVGRGRQADVMIDDASLSRLHARVVVDAEGQITIDDLGSTNGIFVNGSEQLSSYLMLGDTIRFGRVEYLVGNKDDTEPTTRGTGHDRVADGAAPRGAERRTEGRSPGARSAPGDQPRDDGVRGFASAARARPRSPVQHRQAGSDGDSAGGSHDRRHESPGR